jgi:anaerobic ribonucleoside-triphosphate reductase activating protein
MYYGKIDPMSIVDGEGCRVSLFVSGCRNHCRGCFNEETWDFNYGSVFTPIEENEIIESCKKSYIAGLSILGGDPFEEENQICLVDFIEKFKKKCPTKTLWMYTGYVLDRDLLFCQRKWVEGVTDRILNQVDVLVDGPFIQAQRDLSLRFRGSSNQRLLDKATIQSMMK